MSVNITAIVDEYKERLDGLVRRVEKSERMTSSETNQIMADALGDALRTFINDAVIKVDAQILDDDKTIDLDIDPSSSTSVTGSITIPEHTGVIT